jgi:hypothetical protein
MKVEIYTPFVHSCILICVMKGASPPGLAKISLDTTPLPFWHPFVIQGVEYDRLAQFKR